MNRSYRSIWNESLGAWVAASEITRSRGKGGVVVAMAGLLALAIPLHAAADTAIGLAKIDNGGGGVCSTVDFPSTASSSWTCQVPNGSGGFATISGIGSTAAGLPNTSQLATLVSNNLGAGAVLIGSTTTSAAGQNAIAIGAGAKAISENAVVMGNRAGVGSNAASTYQIAIGNGTGQNVNGTDNIALGRDAGGRVAGSGNIAFGQTAGRNVTGVGNLSMGLGAGYRVEGSGNIAFGANTAQSVTGDRNVAIGDGAGYMITASETTAVGNLANASKDRGTALGASTSVTVAEGVALGSNSVASTAAGIAGYVPVGAGVAQAANIAGTKSTLASVSVGDVATNKYRQITGVAAGTELSDAVNVAQLQAVQSQVSVAGNKWIIGSQPDASYVAPVATGTASTSVGSGAIVNANDSVAVGTGAVASVNNSVALGNGSTTTAAKPTASATIRGTTYNFAGANPAGVVSVGSVGAERQIQNVAAGQLSATSTDAVNGSQLYATNLALESISAVAGVGINVTTAATGTGVAIGTSVANVGPGGTATYTAGNNMVLTQNGANTTFAVNDNPNFNSVTVGGTSITQNGINAGGNVVSNVAPGVAGTDAVNVNQLNSASAANTAYTDARVNALGNDIRGVAKNAYAGVAAAMAVQMPGSYVPGKTVMRIGGAVFKGESAVGVSFRRTAENNGWSVTGGVGLSRAGAAVTAGVEWVFN